MSEKSNASGDSPLDTTERNIMRILDNHKGQENAISMLKLGELAGIGERQTREVINKLILNYGISVASSSKRGKEKTGYFLPVTKYERWSFYFTFKNRAITSILKAAAVMNAPAIVAANEIMLKSVVEGKKVPGIGKAIETLIEHFMKEPELYKKEIAAVQSKFGSFLIARDRITAINTAAEEAQKKILELQQSIGGLI